MATFHPDPTLIGPRNHRQQVPYDALWAKLVSPRSRDEIVQDKHQMALQSCLYHGSMTHLKCSYGLAIQMSVTVTTPGLVIFFGSGLSI